MTILPRIPAGLLLLAVGLSAQEARPAPAFGRIEGRVVDAMGKPVPQAEVWLANTKGPRQRTDGDGMFAFSRLPDGYQAVRATAADCSVASAVPRVTPDTPFHFAHLVLLPGTTIVVRVRDDKGNPIAGAHVLPSRTASPGYFFTERSDRFETDAAGRVAIDHVALGDANINAWAPEFGFGSSRCCVGDGTEVEVTLLRTKALQVRIELTGATPDQVRAATWRMYANRDGTSAGCGLPLPLERGTLDADGTKTITGLPLDMELRDIAITLPGAVVDPNRVNLEPASKTQVLEQTLKFRVLPAKSQKVAGTVVGPDGKPLVGLLLTCRSFPDGNQRDTQTRTDAQGSFTFSDVAPDGTEFRLTSLDPRWVFDQPKDGEHDAIRYRRQFVARIGGDTNVEAHCIAATDLRGRVVDADRRGVAGASVELQTTWQKTRNLSAAWTTSDREGLFALPRQNGAEEREVWIQVSSPQGEGRSAPFRMQVGAAIQVPEIRVPPSGAVTGVVRNRAGKPVAGASIWLSTGDGTELQETISGRDGSFRLPGLAPGSYRFYCHLGHQKDAKDPEQVVVRDGETVVVSPVRG